MADPAKKPLKPPTRPRSLPAFVYGVPESPPPFMGPVPAQPEVYAPLGWLRPYLQPLGDFVEGFVGTQADPMSPPGSPVPSRAALAGAVAGVVNPLTPLRALGRGLYSRVDDALRLLPVKGAHANKVLSILKSNASAEELAYRKVPEWLAAQGNTPVTPEALAAHLQAHPAPVPKVTVRGASTDPAHVYAARDLLEHGATREEAMTGLQQAYRDSSREALKDALDAAIDPNYPAGPTKFGNYTVPGGEHYRETLLTLPSDVPAMEARIKELDNVISYGDEVDRATLNEVYAERERLQHNLRSGVDTFRSGHWEEPNIVVHTRANERTLPTGERGRFVEEVQSDWHQAGKKQGYQGPGASPAEIDAAKARLAHARQAYDQRAQEIVATRPSDPVDYRHPGLQDVGREMDAADDALRALGQQGTTGVPDAPFKETWPDLGLKQQLLETAADPDAQWLGFTSGQTQAARYDLRKQIARVEFDAGDRQLRAFDHEGREVIRQTTGPENLPDYIGKEAAEKLLASTPSLHPDDQTPLYSLIGDDLAVGGEGMQYFYDQLLRKRLEKIVKPFGGTVERGRISGDPSAPPEVVAQYANQPEHPFTKNQNIPMWFARLSPEMKARIQREGLPLLTFLGGASLASLGRPRQPEAR